VDPDKIKAAFLEKFKTIANERIDKLEELFDKIEDNPSDEDTAEQLMRELHTLKGESRMMGFSKAGRILHAIEDVLKYHQDKSFTDVGNFSDVYKETLVEVSGVLIHDEKCTVDATCQKLAQCLEQDKASDADGAEKAASPEQKPKAGAKNKTGDAKQSIKAAKGAKATSAAPKPQAATSTTDDRVVDLSRYKLSKMVRVEGTKLDQLSDMAGELFSAHLRLHELTSGLEGLTLDARSLAGNLERFSATIEGGNGALEDMVTGFQSLYRDLARMRWLLHERSSGTSTMLDYLLEHVQQIRLLPVSNLFHLYRAAARDIARGTGKQIEVKLEGESTLVDRSILDALGDIMLHLIRNAADHGIESSAERSEAGKNPRGTLILRARPVDDKVWIEVEDDGRGIDPERVVQKALTKGLLSAEQADRIDPDDAIELIFLPGFTTAEIVTDFSGRGVGMDVVRTKLQDLGGAIRVVSTPGQGSRFTLELPTSIAIARVLLFGVADQVFALLATFVEKVDRVDPSALIRTPTGQAIQVDGKTITVADAGELLRLGKTIQASERIPLVFVEHGGRRLALAVDKLIGERELSIKPFSPYLSDVRAVSGVATLEDGTLVLVLHAGEIASSGTRAGKTLLQALIVEQGKTHRVLLVEDSLITRELEKSVLLSFGLEVEEAGDGLEALEKLASGQFDMIVSDVEMPRMTGFELTRSIKQSEKFAHLPVILVTTLGADADRRRGMEAGADGYVVKSEFGSQSFLDLVRRFLS
jgi:two-component system chemotaxis sensor kinase CheA